MACPNCSHRTKLERLEEEFYKDAVSLFARQDKAGFQMFAKKFLDESAFEYSSITKFMEGKERGF